MTVPDLPRPLPSDLVRGLFEVRGPLSPLPGGRGTSLRAGELVLKPHHEDAFAEARWCAEVMERVHEATETKPGAEPADGAGFRVARPIRSFAGDYLVEGWSATLFLDGGLHTAGPDDWPAFFAAARAFNDALREVERPDLLDVRTHRWALADRVAFGEPYPEPVPKSKLLLDALLKQRRPHDESREPSRLVHGDFAGNVLFAPGFAPAVIDFSPYWRPAAFSYAIAAVDGLLWYDAPVTVLELAAEGLAPEEFADHLIRALIFRLVAANEFFKEDRGISGFDVGVELDRYDRVYELVKQYQHVARARASRPFDAVLCDIDGVLRRWPSVEPVEEVHGVAPGTLFAAAFAPQRLLPAITGRVTDEQWRAAVAADLADSGELASPAAARALVADWSAMRPTLDENVLALLELAREIVPVALVSNATTRLEADLGNGGLAGLIDTVVNSARVGFAKPDPRFYAYAAERVGVSPERCLFIDDSLENVEAAGAAGMQAVQFHDVADLDDALRPLFPLLRDR